MILGNRGFSNIYVSLPRGRFVFYLGYLRIVVDILVYLQGGFPLVISWFMYNPHDSHPQS